MIMRNVLATSTIWVLIVIGGCQGSDKAPVINELAGQQQMNPAEEQTIESKPAESTNFDLLQFMLQGPMPGIEKELFESLTPYFAELSLRLMLIYYDYSTLSLEDGKPISPSESLRALGDIVARFSPEHRPRLAPLASVFHFRYPTSQWKLDAKETSELTFHEILPRCRIDQEGIPTTVMHVTKRLNVEGDIRSADCYLLLLVYPGKNEEMPQVVWIHCEFRWNPESESWKLISARQFEEGEDFSLED